MVLPNVNEFMPSLSSLQLVPPPIAAADVAVPQPATTTGTDTNINDHTYNSNNRGSSDSSNNSGGNVSTVTDRPSTSKPSSSMKKHSRRGSSRSIASGEWNPFIPAVATLSQHPALSYQPLDDRDDHVVTNGRAEHHRSGVERGRNDTERDALSSTNATLASSAVSATAMPKTPPKHPRNTTQLQRKSQRSPSAELLYFPENRQSSFRSRSRSRGSSVVRNNGGRSSGVVSSAANASSTLNGTRSGRTSPRGRNVLRSSSPAVQRHLAEVVAIGQSQHSQMQQQNKRRFRSVGPQRSEVALDSLSPAKTKAKSTSTKKQQCKSLPPVSPPCLEKNGYDEQNATTDATKEGYNSNNYNNKVRSRSTTQQPFSMIGSQKIFPRTLITPSIYHNAATDLWIATINTDPNAVSSNNNSINNTCTTAPFKSNAYNSKYIKAFSFHSEKEARASAYANSPPQLIPFACTPNCKLCNATFTSILRRPKHCRNCGIVICSSYNCSTFWNAKMVPETYISNKKNVVRVCCSCDSLAKMFKNSLLNGRYDVSVECFLRGNVNLRCPFVFKEDKEVM
eukprot:scaffold693_cov200-Alexandrium_tamarense.AAC.9